MVLTLPVLNLAEARFDCTFGRGCDGVCCRNGRPFLYPDEVARLDAALPRLLPKLRPKARAAVEAGGYVTMRRKRGAPVVRVVDGWCAFFNAGCTLHRLGLTEGDAFAYKPAVCALFPLDRDHHDRWYVRQRGSFGEVWDLPCLDPSTTARPAAESLRAEIELAWRFTSASAQGDTA